MKLSVVKLEGKLLLVKMLTIKIRKMESNIVVIKLEEALILGFVLELLEAIVGEASCSPP